MAMVVVAVKVTGSLCSCGHRCKGGERAVVSRSAPAELENRVSVVARTFCSGRDDGVWLATSLNRRVFRGGLRGL